MPQLPTIPLTDYAEYTCEVKLNGQPLPPSYELMTLQVKKGYQHITSAEISFKQTPNLGDDPESLLLSTTGIAGMQLQINAVKDFDSIPLFDGLVVRSKFTMTANGVRFEIAAKEAAVKMSMQHTSETFASQTDKDVIESLVNKVGCTLDAGTTSTQFLTRHRQLVKHGMSDWDFINVRAEANGCYVFTEGNSVVLQKPDSQLDISKVLGIQQGDFFSLNLEQDERTYRINEKVVGYDTTTLQSEVDTEMSAIMPGLFPDGTNEVINYGSFNPQENNLLVQAAGNARLHSQKNGVLHMRAQPQAKPGFAVRLQQINPLVNGEYLVTSVLQEFSKGTLSTHLQFGLNNSSYTEKFNIHSAAISPGLVVGIVVQLEQDPDNQYRILVRPINWPSAHENLWTRMATIYAGSNHGLMALPEIGDEVVLGFFGNDLEAPVVLGSMFSAANTPPAQIQDANNEKIWLTRKGMKWSWNDEKGIHEISTPAGNAIILSEDEQKISITDQNQNKIEMSADGIAMESQMELKIKSSAKVSMNAPMINIESDGILTLKGSSVMIN